VLPIKLVWDFGYLNTDYSTFKENCLLLSDDFRYFKFVRLA
jgi:hypothetical protein